MINQIVFVNDAPRDFQNPNYNTIKLTCLIIVPPYSFPQQLLGKKLLLVSNFPSPRTHNLPRSLRIPIEVSPVSERWFQVLALETEADSPGKKAFRIKSERRFPAEMRDAGADDIGVHVSSSRVGRPAARWSDRERHTAAYKARGRERETRIKHERKIERETRIKHEEERERETETRIKHEEEREREKEKQRCV